MSLSTSWWCRRRSAAASLRSVRNPWSIQAESEPPGRRPPAPGSHFRRTHSVTGGPFVSSGFVNLAGLRQITVDRFHPRGTPSYEVGLAVLLTITDVLTTGRCARFAHNPWSFRWIRTPWPPSSSTRFLW